MESASSSGGAMWLGMRGDVLGDDSSGNGLLTAFGSGWIVGNPLAAGQS